MQTHNIYIKDPQRSLFFADYLVCTENQYRC